MTTSTGFDLLSPDVLRLVALYSEGGAPQFPALDCAVLQQAVARVRERHAAVARAELSLAAAQAALDDEHDALLRTAGRVHAYLRIYAEGDDALRERVEAIHLPRPRRGGRGDGALVGLDSTEVATTPKRRGRPPKATNVAPLFPVSAPAPVALMVEAGA